jgi:tRNA pseudouridine55 synthase
VTAAGILLVDKPGGMTSHDVVARGRKRLGTRRVGHAGTLDPMATGLLVLGTGSATRLLTYLVGLDKTYEATIRLGESTNTDDAEGESTGRFPVAFGDDELEAGIRSLTGDLLQRPSTVSAIKVGGKRAYALARAGEEVELAARPVTVHEFVVLAVRREIDTVGVGSTVDLDVRISCSSGTYIRALARDLGTFLGSGGHLTALRRHIERADPVTSGP